MNTTKVPVTFWIIGVIALLWNLMGLMAYYGDMTISQDALSNMSEDWQQMYLTQPIWVKIAYGLATIGGTLGAIGLLMRKKWAVPVFLISLIGIVIQVSYNLFGTKLMEIASSSELMLPIMIVLIALFLWYYAKKSASRGWLS
jgi:hypothetical protein